MPQSHQNSEIVRPAGSRVAILRPKAIVEVPRDPAEAILLLDEVQPVVGVRLGRVVRVTALKVARIRSCALLVRYPLCLRTTASLQIIPETRESS